MRRPTEEELTEAKEKKTSIPLDRLVTDFRHCLIEADKGSKESQLGALRRIGLPITAIIDSGGRSIHLWVRIDAKDREEYRERVTLLHQFCRESLGLEVDPQNTNPSRYSRMPNGNRMRINKETGKPVLDADGKPIIDRPRLLGVNVPGKTWDEWSETLSSVATAQKPLPAFESWDDLEDAELPELKMILEGVFNQGAKMTVGGDSKAGKTWLLTHLAFSIATGRDWLGIKTYQGRVLYVNCELQKQIFKKRGQSIKSAMGIKVTVPNLVTWTTRGHFLTAEAFKEAILERIGDEQFDVIIIDPLYKLLNGADANSAGEMQKILSELEQIAERAGAGLIYADHFAKGNSAAKKSVDRISGSGVTARDPDAILTFTEHEEPGCLSLEFTLRNYRPMDAVVVSKPEGGFLFERRDELDPSKLKRTGGVQRKFTEEQLLKCLPNESGISSEDWFKAVEKATGMKNPTFLKLRTSLKKREDVHMSEIEGTPLWAKTYKGIERTNKAEAAKEERLRGLGLEDEDDPFED